jgi:hypothetical protein
MTAGNFPSNVTREGLSVWRRVKRAVPAWALALSARFQPRWLSKMLHGRQYRSQLKLLPSEIASREYHEHKILWDAAYRRAMANGPQVRLEEFVPESNLSRIAIDIGSGTVWLARELLDHFDRVIAIEPSTAAKALADAWMGPPRAGSTVEWHSDFAQEIIPTPRIQEPAFFVTAVVLSRLPDSSVAEICGALVEKLPVGSQGVLWEPWGRPHSQPMWFIRSPSWWESVLPGFALDFLAPSQRRKLSMAWAFEQSAHEVAGGRLIPLSLTVVVSSLALG